LHDSHARGRLSSQLKERVEHDEKIESW
jgi:hypothetical protein